MFVQYVKTYNLSYRLSLYDDIFVFRIEKNANNYLKWGALDFK